MIPNRYRWAAPAILAIALTACGLHRIPPPSQRIAPAVAPEQASATPPAQSAQTLADGLLAAARARHAEAAAAWPDWPERGETERLLTAAERAARTGDDGRMRDLATQALQRADEALDTAYLLRADVELQKLQTYTGLSDEQLERMRVAELALARRQGRSAWELLNALNRELAQANKRYVVAAGDSLWVISGRPEIYGNPYLWPLVWEANLDVIRDPNRLRAGQQLRIRLHPTIEQVVRAIETARSYRRTTVHIGEVRETTP
ncbi:LysM domain-containing protein [Fontimonas thermophila]|uniref:LysM domain-containing protein n=1 Tax=Fontimonas thermophila TaxID=1076937 RepID=A0A1I2IS01_9GAMM|nr:LysM peptidoglycan-binding domain-containing protein [Fontimonas thermophila]SFF43291.1 LysM domain-containing protein [Fontimonas thermophila]